MKTIYLKVLLITLALFLFINKTSNSNILSLKVIKKVEIKRSTIAIKEPVNYLDSLMAFIPKHEGLRLNPYLCLAKRATVGYGHVITHKDKGLTFPLTKTQADNLLKKDILKAKRYVTLNVPDSVNLSGKEFWLLVHFSYCKGVGNFNRSNLKKMVYAKKDTALINNELKKWCYYKTPSGKKKKTTWSYKIRLAEINFLETGSFGTIFK